MDQTALARRQKSFLRRSILRNTATGAGDDYPPDPKSWLKAAEKHEGSWWPHGTKWIDGHSRGRKVPAYHPGEGKLPFIEPARGSYVRAQ